MAFPGAIEGRLPVRVLRACLAAFVLLVPGSCVSQERPPLVLFSKVQDRIPELGPGNARIYFYRLGSGPTSQQVAVRREDEILVKLPTWSVSYADVPSGPSQLFCWTYGSLLSLNPAERRELDLELAPGETAYVEILHQGAPILLPVDPVASSENLTYCFYVEPEPSAPPEPLEASSERSLD